MKILVVDDEEIIVRGIIKHLSKIPDMNISALGTYSAQEALNTLEQFHPKLLLTDIRMPDMDGLTLIETARRKGLCENCMILTAYEEFDYARRALENAVIGYLVKPIDWNVLDEHLYKLVSTEEKAIQAEDIMHQYTHVYPHVSNIDSLSPSMRKICRYIQKHYADDLSLTRLSFQTGFAESYICTLFKKQIGITFLDYVNELRMQQAIYQLIAQPRVPIKNVSMMVGYGSERQLYRLFKQYLDMTPQQFRALHLGTNADQEDKP